MLDSLQTKILDAQVEFIDRKLITPLRLSSGLITDVCEARVAVRVETAGQQGIGRGAIYLSDLWAWPDPTIPRDTRVERLRAICEHIAKNLRDLCGEPAHPLELGLHLHDRVAELAAGPGDAANVPLLALSMCGSPFDAALHDAAGRATNRSAFDFYPPNLKLPSADAHFVDRDAAGAIRRLLTPQREQLPAWVIVGKDDNLETLGQRWFRERGYRCFKLKIGGKDNAADAARTVEVFRAARSWGIENPTLSIDSNEANADAASVLDYLERLRAADASAFAALAYIEQPTSRDIVKHPNDWRPVAALKPVMLDEGLTSLELLGEAIAQGWSGLALKTCKGHSFALVAAAWARQRGLLLSMQDLTNPGFSAIHSALMASRLPVINGVELNSPQFTPDANAEWLPRLAALFDPRDGSHRAPPANTPGLGSSL